MNVPCRLGSLTQDDLRHRQAKSQDSESDRPHSQRRLLVILVR
jgi:hypothetical protein